MRRWHYLVLVIVAPACLLAWWAIDPLGNLLRWLDEQRTPFEDRGWEDPEQDWSPMPGHRVYVGTVVDGQIRFEERPLG